MRFKFAAFGNFIIILRVVNFIKNHTNLNFYCVLLWYLFLIIDVFQFNMKDYYLEWNY